jgi:hypothetical protein
MAKMLLVGDAIRPNALSAYLRDGLPDDFTVVAAPVVGHCALDAIVVGPGGLTLIAAEGSRPVAPTTSAGDSTGWRSVRRLFQQTGVPGSPQSKLSHEQVATATLQTFLGDVFPALQPPVYYLQAQLDITAESSSWCRVGAAGESSEDLSMAVARIQASSDQSLSSSDMRDKVAVALRDREFTVSMRATRPFVFRRTNWLGARSSAWTIRDLVILMDRYPLDGVYHLYNGSLEHWLEEQGALDLAELARTARDKARSDRRKAVEIFLSGTGLVAPPQLVARPKILDMGYAITGETIMGHVRLSRGRGRGYLFGSVKPGAPWLKVWPGSIEGSTVDLTVTADTLPLPIRTEPYEGHVLVDCNEAAEPILLPVRMCVVPSPTRVNRFLFRPFVALLLGLILGMLVGVLWAQVAPALPTSLTSGLQMGSVLIWMLSVMVLWALTGLVRGLFQPLPWSVFHAARGWLFRLALWAPVLALVGFGLSVWWQGNFVPPGQATGLLSAQAALAGLVLATIPATVFSLQRRPPPLLAPPARLLYIASEQPSPRGGASWVGDHARWIIWCTLGVVVVFLVLVFAPKLARTDWVQVRSQDSPVVAQNWIEAQWGELNAGANDLLDRLYLLRYDRRAPLPQTAAPTPLPQGTPTVANSGEK